MGVTAQNSSVPGNNYNSGKKSLTMEPGSQGSVTQEVSPAHFLTLGRLDHGKPPESSHRKCYDGEDIQQNRWYHTSPALHRALLKKGHLRNPQGGVMRQDSSRMKQQLGQQKTRAGKPALRSDASALARSPLSTPFLSVLLLTFQSKP